MTRWGLLLFLGACLIGGCSGPYSQPTVAAKPAEEAVSVRVRTLAMETVPEIISATGELYAEDVATLSAKVPGRLERLRVDLGSRVRAGDVIAELEREDYEFRVRQAEAMVEQTRARLSLGARQSDKIDPAETAIVRQAAASLREASLMHTNAVELFKQGVISKVDYERAGVALQAAQARHQAAIEEVYRLQAELLERRAQLALARQQLSDTVIRASFDGAVTRRQAAAGEFLPVNAPLAEVVRLHPLRIRLEVPERLATKVQIGQRIDLQVEGHPAGQGGRVVRLSPALQPQNRSLLLEGEIPNEDGALRPGSFAEGIITVDPKARGLALPASAIVSFAGVDRVFVVENGRASERIVRLGRKLGDTAIQVVSGVRPGEDLILNPSDRLANGGPVTATPES